MAVYDRLDSLGIDYLRADHGEAYTMEQCLRVDEALGACMCKNLFLCNRQRTKFYLFLTPGDRPFRTKHFSAALGISRVSFGEEEDMVRLLGVTPSSVSLMGLMWDGDGLVELVIDRALTREEYFGCHPCVNTSSLRMRWEDVRDILIPSLGHSPTYVELPTEE